MIAVDTNILVRYVTNDDPLQARRALAILARQEDIFIPKTVLLETEWVLRAVYELPVESILKALLHILGLPNVVAENPEEVSLALDYYSRRLDFADALHLASSCHADSFFSFDAAFVKRGKKIGARVEKG
ncbi:PilT protein domain protein [Geobacter metallireducens RCH3]|uniref:Toxin, PIN family n=1 Tax=Geobacter metallireducens (strain ATCC 53774 / DSM 7210 / GS-15) TaxID=269799 RepID=Q39VZ9_GEOMG|nr:type II toxin-antitoxin system VapC family toxin [Geobacter metallireducens]ABB31575.2 toxin, PIN family [Geobacter metallireducens GS-15]EHP86663.1 PilT protein domain protein [Geobacter metallireducens RCH3]